MNKKHGESGADNGLTSEYRSWAAMKRRCTQVSSRSYPNYGGRGISIFNAWLNDYPAFLAYMGRKIDSSYTIERIDSNGNYEPGNCKWASRSEQQRNKRRAVIIEFNGERQNLVEWGMRLGERPELIKWRLNAGWSVERAVTTPVAFRKNRSSRVPLLIPT